MDYEQILVEQVDAVLTITLNRPEKLNAYTPVMMGELISAVTAANDDRSVGAIIVTGMSVILTGVFMMSRVRTIFFPRNPYLFSDMTWGLMYVLHGLAGVGLITLVIVHVYFAIRPEKLPITASMIVGTMSREFYLKEHDPKRWVVDASSNPPRSMADGD